MRVWGSTRWSPGGQRLARFNTYYGHLGALTEPTFRMSFWDALPAASSWNLGVRSVVFAEVGGFDERLPVGEDVDLCWRAQLAGHELGEVEAVMHVRMRTGLRDVFRQAYSYGRADHQLAERFADVRRSTVVPTEVSTSMPSDMPTGTEVPDLPEVMDALPGVTPPPVVGSLPRALRKVLSVRRPSDLTYAVRRLGRVCGSRFGRLDRSVPRYGGPVPGRVVVHDSGVVPVVSVVVPAFDAEGTLGEQLEALAGQVGAPVFEVLVCDNGSRDGTAGVVRSFVGRSSGAVAWSGLRLVDASVRRGPAAARNVGAGVARGEHLLFCDADDVVSPGWVAALHAGLTDTDLVAGGLEWERLNARNKASVSWSEGGAITLAFRPDLAGAPSNNLGVRADVFTELGGFDESLRTGEDLDLCWRAQLGGGTLRRVPEAVVHARKRDGLRAVYRQAYSYAVGIEELRRRYAQESRSVPDPAVSATPLPEADGTTRRTPSGTRAAAVAERLRRLATRAASVRGTGDFADVAWRLGQDRGRRAGRRAG